MLNHVDSAPLELVEVAAKSTSFVLYNSPIGALLIVASEESLLEVRFSEECRQRELPHRRASGSPLCATVVTQLDAYFAGELQKFDLPLDPQGTPFQKMVWSSLQDIPYGKTISYGELARRIDRPTASRAVGAANGQNPIPIVIPCHRVIGGNGSLTGYGGGLHRKEALLKLERTSVAAMKRFDGKMTQVVAGES